MTDEEKELEQKMKQYEYEIEENKKQMERLQRDNHKKSGKKSFTYKLSKFIGRTLIVYEVIFFSCLFFALIFALQNYINGLQFHNHIKKVEEKYSMKLEKKSRKAENKIITYKVVPKDKKYKKVKFTIVQIGSNYGSISDDFGSQYLKSIVEKTKVNHKEIMKDFEPKEQYDENGLLDYKLVIDGNIIDADQKINNLKLYIINYNKKSINIIKDLDERIIKR